MPPHQLEPLFVSQEAGPNPYARCDMPHGTSSGSLLVFNQAMRMVPSSREETDQ
jgi:hypothetical protein